MPLALYLLALAVFAMGTSEFMLAGLVPNIAAGLGVTIGAAGLLTSAFAVGMVIGAPAMAVLARRWPARSSLLGCLVVFALCHIVGALTPNFPVLFGTRAIAALANAGFLAVALSTAAALVAADQKGRALSVLLGGTTVATIAGVPGGAVLGALLGWRSAFWAIALLCLPAALGILRGIPGRAEGIRSPRSMARRYAMSSLNSHRRDWHRPYSSPPWSTRARSPLSRSWRPSSPTSPACRGCGCRWRWCSSGSGRSSV